MLSFIREEGGASHLRASRDGEETDTVPVLLSGRVERVLIHRPEDLEHILIHNPLNYDKGKRVGVLAPMLGDGLVTQRDEAVHSSHRKLVNPAFSPSAIRRYADGTTRDCIRALLDRLKALAATTTSGSENRGSDAAEVEIDMQPQLDETALRVISEVAFRRTDFAEFSNRLRSVQFETSIGLVLDPRIATRLPIKMVRSARSLRRLLAETVNKAAKEVKAENEARQGGGDDTAARGAIIDYLVSDAHMTQEQLVDHCITFVFAGHDTTSTTLNWTLALLASHREVQEKLFEELHASVSYDVAPHIAEVKELTYLRWVLYESMRYCPPVLMTMRDSVSDDVLPHSDTYIPANTSIIVSIFSAHRSKRTWGENADEFVPERWAEEGIMDRVLPCGFMPFGAGKRNCIGKEFAVNEMLIALASIVRTFELSWPEGQVMPKRKFAVVTKPAEPIQVKLRCRQE